MTESSQLYWQHGTYTHISSCWCGHNRGKPGWLRKLGREMYWTNTGKIKNREQLTFSLSVRDTRAASPDPRAAGVPCRRVMLWFGWLLLLLFGLLGGFMCHGNLLLVQCKSIWHSLLPWQTRPVITSWHLWQLHKQRDIAYYTWLLFCF